MRNDARSGPDAAEDHRRHQARACCERAVRSGAELYDRARHLPGLARATPQEIASGEPAVGRNILGRLMRALRAERRRGRAGHWSYDLNRHIALMQAITAERARLGGSPDRGKENGIAPASAATGAPGTRPLALRPPPHGW